MSFERKSTQFPSIEEIDDKTLTKASEVRSQLIKEKQAARREALQNASQKGMPLIYTESKSNKEEKWSYKLLNGDKTDNILSSIRGLNKECYAQAEGHPPKPKHPSELTRPKKTIDYRATFGSRTGICELWGRRQTQEDRIDLGRLTGFKQLFKKNAIRALSNSVIKANVAVLQKDLSDGSCFCSSVISGNQVYTTNTGDSFVFAAVLDAKGKVIEFKQLNKKLHNRKEKSEESRLKKINRWESVSNIHLEVTRSIGDEKFKNQGTIPDPNVYVDTIEIPKGGSAFIINSCDGLLEPKIINLSTLYESNYGDLKDEFEKPQPPCLSLEKIQKIITDNRKQKPEFIAEKLAQAAFKNGVHDNISVIVTAVDATSPNSDFRAVYDGHGGDQTADFLHDHYQEILTQEIQSKLSLQADYNKFIDQFNDPDLTIAYYASIHYQDELLTHFPEATDRNLTLFFDALDQAEKTLQNQPQKNPKLFYQELNLLLQSCQMATNKLMPAQVEQSESHKKFFDAIAISAQAALREYDGKNAIELSLYILNAFKSFKKLIDSDPNLLSQIEDKIGLLYANLIDLLRAKLTQDSFFKNISNDLDNLEVTFLQGNAYGEEQLKVFLLKHSAPSSGGNQLGLFSTPINPSSPWLDNILSKLYPEAKEPGVTEKPSLG